MICPKLCRSFRLDFYRLFGTHSSVAPPALIRHLTNQSNAYCIPEHSELIPIPHSSICGHFVIPYLAPAVTLLVYLTTQP